MPVATLAPKLFTYCIVHDAGSAPNPYGGVCTLAICKPKIRAAARVGDWVAATGSKAFPMPDSHYRLIYAMQVTDIKTIEEYDRYCRKSLKLKIPKRPARTFDEFVGDSIYHYANDGSVTQLPSVHDGSNQERDLSGVNVLLSSRFAYFGDSAPLIPKSLHPIIKSGPGHQVDKNQALLGEFVAWITSLGLNGVCGKPITKIENWRDSKATGSCTRAHLEDDGE
jgi:hypothetical protein